MTIDIVLLTSEKSNAEGFPLVVRVSHGANVPKKKTIARCWPEQFSDAAKMITESHPDYDVLAPRIMNIKLKARQIKARGETSQAKAMADLFKDEAAGVTFMEYYKILKTQMEDLAAAHEKKGDVKARNRVRGNLKVYENAVTQFGLSVKDVALSDIDHPTLLKFKNQQLNLGNAKATVHQYLRTLRAIYNKGVLYYKMEDTKPFTGLFSGLAVKSYDSRKKHLDRAAIAVLEGLELAGSRRRSLDLWLLQFYFGGADFTDIYHLERSHLRRGRVWLERGKVDGGAPIDLKIHPKALAILKRYGIEGQWVFPWRKDEKGYEGFRRRYQRDLVDIQEAQNAKADAEKKKKLRVDVLPGGGKLGIKVARHSFANIAKGLMIDPDIIRELQGHERNDVDNFYKDKFPEKVRDEALFRIIG